MKRSFLAMGLLTALAVAATQCGADPGATAEAPGAAQAALSSVGTEAETSSMVELACGGWHVEITRATGTGSTEERATGRCEQSVRDNRPHVHCDTCRYQNACLPLTRRSDIITHCTLEDGTWTCTCAQRTVLGCSPCQPASGANAATAASPGCAPAE